MVHAQITRKRWTPSGEQVGLPNADAAGEGGRSHGERTGEVEFTRPAASLEIPIDGRDGYLFGCEGDARSCADAGAAAGVDELHTDFYEEVVPSFTLSQGLNLT